MGKIYIAIGIIILIFISVICVCIVYLKTDLDRRTDDEQQIKSLTQYNRDRKKSK